MTVPGSDAPRPAGVHPHGHERNDISLARIYLPFAMVITFGAFLVIGGYAAGGFMSGIARDKTETDSRLSAIEKDVTAIKNMLVDRMGSLQGCNCRNK